MLIINCLSKLANPKNTWIFLKVIDLGHFLIIDTQLDSILTLLVVSKNPENDISFIQKAHFSHSTKNLCMKSC